ncbi:MAG: cytochrome c [Balneolaceae bacterium]|nr:cytochrome c [Balneolaceae bacterium]
MRKLFKVLGVIVGVLITSVLLVVLVTYLITEYRWNRTYELTMETVEVSADPAVIEHGRHIATIRGCVDCHGENLAGRIFIEDPIAGRIVATNLTSGEGGIGSSYTDEDLIRSIRKGIKSDGKPTLFMPAYEYIQIHERDLSTLISYIRSVEPVDNILPDNKLAIPMRAMYVLQGNIPLFSAEMVDLSTPIPTIEPVTLHERGQYLATSCMGCHGRDMKGGTIPGVPPHWPPATDLTMAGSMATWIEADFFRAMRDGRTPDGRVLNAEFMPYPILGTMTDEELQSLYVYLSSLGQIAAADELN